MGFIGATQCRRRHTRGIIYFLCHPLLSLCFSSDGNEPLQLSSSQAALSLNERLTLTWFTTRVKNVWTPIQCKMLETGFWTIVQSFLSHSISFMCCETHGLFWVILSRFGDTKLLSSGHQIRAMNCSVHNSCFRRAK